MNDFMSMAYGLAFWLGKSRMEGRFDTNRGLDVVDMAVYYYVVFHNRGKVLVVFVLLHLDCTISFAVYCCFLLPPSLKKWHDRVHITRRSFDNRKLSSRYESLQNIICKATTCMPRLRVS